MRTSSRKRCRLRCKGGHLSDEGRRICDREFRRCARCRKYVFMIHRGWRWKLCGTCHGTLRQKGGPGKRWRVGA